MVGGCFYNIGNYSSGWFPDKSLGFGGRKKSSHHVVDCVRSREQASRRSTKTRTHMVVRFLSGRKSLRGLRSNHVNTLNEARSPPRCSSRKPSHNPSNTVVLPTTPTFRSHKHMTKISGFQFVPAETLVHVAGGKKKTSRNRADAGRVSR